MPMISPSGWESIASIQYAMGMPPMTHWCAMVEAPVPHQQLACVLILGHGATKENGATVSNVVVFQTHRNAVDQREVNAKRKLEQVSMSVSVNMDTLETNANCTHAPILHQIMPRFATVGMAQGSLLEVAVLEWTLVPAVPLGRDPIVKLTNATDWSIRIQILVGDMELVKQMKQQFGARALLAGVWMPLAILAQFQFAMEKTLLTTQQYARDTVRALDRIRARVRQVGQVMSVIFQFVTEY
mmetsp:Transcript_10436/g.38806  ORF Transcript_10436/g.38806 Transcript_10436/m.38806 type:complete len:242 (-) Transcript_10436:3432-4157(-)